MDGPTGPYANPQEPPNLLGYLLGQAFLLLAKTRCIAVVLPV